MAKTSLQPLADWVVAEQEEAVTKTASGLYLPDKAIEKPKIARVLEVGKKVKEVKVGDRIVYKSWSNPEKIGDREYVFVKEEDILAVLKVAVDPRNIKPRSGKIT